jgi:hypothetical protein
MFEQIRTFLDQTVKLPRLCHVPGEKNKPPGLNPSNQIPQPVGQLGAGQPHDN